MPKTNLPKNSPGCVLLLCLYKTVIYFLNKPELIKKQLNDCSKTLEGIKSKTSSSKEAAKILSNYLIT